MPFAPGPEGLNDSINSVMAQGIGYDFYDTVNFQSARAAASAPGTSPRCKGSTARERAPMRATTFTG